MLTTLFMLKHRSGALRDPERRTALLLLTLCCIAFSARAQQTPAANPARPTVTNPATLPPVGYLQFEQGYLGSLSSPETASQYGVNQVTKVAVASRLMVQLQTQPFAISREVPQPNTSTASGDVLLGTQAVLFSPSQANDAASSPQKKPLTPTVALGYLGRVHSGSAPDIDQGGYANSLVLLISGDLGAFHYDTNYLVNEQIGADAANLTLRRAQFAQMLSVNHPLFNSNLQLSVELYHFTQPLVFTTDDGSPITRANLVDLLIAPSYQLRPNLVLDGGFSRGLTSTSTRWQSFAGFTYLLPHRLWRRKS
jgi:hypothetical protein